MTIRSCVAGIGASIDVKSELLTTDSQSQSVSVTMPQDEVVAGDRVLDVDGRMVDMPQQTTAITDSSTLAATPIGRRPAQLSPPRARRMARRM